MLLNVVMQGSGFPKLRSSVTLLQSQGRNILVDSGLADDAGRLIQALRARGVSPDDVDVVVASHLHYDHCGNHLLFRKAQFIVGARDYADTFGFLEAYHQDTTEGKLETAELLRSKYQAVKEFYVRSIVREVTRNLEFYNRVLARDPRFVPVDGQHWLTDEVQVVPTPGHTHGHISVVAHDARQESDGPPRKVLVAGDAIFTRKTLEEGADRDIHLAADTTAYTETRKRLLLEHRHIIPGHDGLVEVAHAPAKVAV
jgi:glyoxylase-like metal-dependent hydrolase (beta-lactamase superfamily II)